MGSNIHIMRMRIRFQSTARRTLVEAESNFYQPGDSDREMVKTKVF